MFPGFIRNYKNMYQNVDEKRDIKTQELFPSPNRDLLQTLAGFYSNLRKGILGDRARKLTKEGIEPAELYFGSSNIRSQRKHEGCVEDTSTCSYF
jgi:hypothetical protein